MTAPACPLTATEARRLAEMKRLVLDGEPVGNALAFNAEYGGLATKLYGENQYSSVEALNLLADALDRAEKAEAELAAANSLVRLTTHRDGYYGYRPEDIARDRWSRTTNGIDSDLPDELQDAARRAHRANPGDEAVTK